MQHSHYHTHTHTLSGVCLGWGVIGPGGFFLEGGEAVIH